MLHHFISLKKINPLAPLLESSYAFILALVLFGPPVSAEPAVQHQVLVGKAWVKNHELFYTETNHIELKDDRIIKIDSYYKGKDQKLFAELHADFSNDPYIPDTHFIDLRRHYENKLSYKKGEKVIIRQKKNGDWSTHELAHRDAMTNSVGLINYLRENVAELKKQERKTIRYIVAALDDDYGMELKFKSNKKPGLYEFSFRLQNFFIRNLSGVSESSVTFNLETRCMKHFEGVSNIVTLEGKAVDVTLDYDEPTYD